LPLSGRHDRVPVDANPLVYLARPNLAGHHSCMHSFTSFRLTVLRKRCCLKQCQNVGRLNTHSQVKMRRLSNTSCSFNPTSRFAIY
jgi:hypothetical protein